MVLREIIDLDATYGGGPESEAALLNEGASPGIGEGRPVRLPVPWPRAKRRSRREKPAGEGEEGGEGAIGGDLAGALLDYEDEEENISLSAMEAALRPQVLEVFDAISATYKKLAKLQTERLDVTAKGAPRSPLPPTANTMASRLRW